MNIKQWLDENIDLRIRLHDHCIINGDRFAYDDGVTVSIMLYNVQDVRNAAAAVGQTLTFEKSEDGDPDWRGKLKFEYKGFTVYTHVRFDELLEEDA